MFPIYWLASSGGSQESRKVKSWKSRLLMVFTMLAVVLVLSVPAMAEDVDIDVECEADGGYCTKQVSYEVWHKDTEAGSQEEEDVLEDPMDEVSDKAPVDDVSDEAPPDEISDKDCSEHSWPPCGYYWPWPH